MKENDGNQLECWHVPMFSWFALRQEECEFKASLSYKTSPPSFHKESNQKKVKEVRCYLLRNRAGSICSSQIREKRGPLLTLGVWTLKQTSLCQRRASWLALTHCCWCLRQWVWSWLRTESVSEEREKYEVLGKTRDLIPDFLLTVYIRFGTC